MTSLCSEEPRDATGDLASATQAAIVARAHEFQLGALLFALRELGYTDNDIELRSQLTILHQPSLVQTIAFEEQPRHVVVTLNIGLLATQSPLPSFVFRYIEAPGESTLGDFLAFYGHHHLRALALSQTPESFLPRQDPQAARRETLTLLGLATPSTLHWLFTHAFPELEVSVRRSTQDVALLCSSMILGQSVFGDGSTFGELAWVPLPSIDVTLAAEELRSGVGTLWSAEIVRRLTNWLLPRLVERDLHLLVDLLVRDANGFLVLGPQAQLGYQPLYEESATGPHSARRMRLFCGEVSRTGIQQCAAAAEVLGSKS